MNSDLKSNKLTHYLLEYGDFIADEKLFKNLSFTINFKLQVSPLMCHNKINFLNEADFHLGKYVNMQKFRIWGPETPNVVLPKPINPLRVTIWCSLWNGGIMGLFLRN